MAQINALQAERKRLGEQIKAHAKAKHDPKRKANDGWKTAEDRIVWDRLNESYDANLKELETERKIQDRLGKLGNGSDKIGRDGGKLKSGKPQDNFGLALQGWLTNRIGVKPEHREAANALGIDLSAGEFIINLSPTDRVSNIRNQFLANGRRTERVLNALSGQDGATGGYTYGETFINRLELAMLAYGGMFEVSEIIRTPTGEPMRWPTANDTSNTGRQIGESQAVAPLDPVFGQLTWQAWKFTSDEILVPYELLRDNAVNLETVIPQMLGERLGRIQNTKYTTGSGANTAHGIVTRAAAGVTTATATAIAWDELLEMEHSIDPSRRSLGCGWMFHDSIKLALRKLKDGEGRSLWQTGENMAAPDTLLTYPYTINQDMASIIQAGAVTVLFGQLSQYKIRQVGAIRLYRLLERHRENDQDAFLAFISGDGNLLDAGDHPVKKLTQA